MKKRDMLSCDFSDSLYLEGNNTHLPCGGNCYDSVCLWVNLKLNVCRHYHSHIVRSCSESLEKCGKFCRFFNDGISFVALEISVDTKQRQDSVHCSVICFRFILFIQGVCHRQISWKQLGQRGFSCFFFFEVLMISQHILAALRPLFRAATCHQIIQDTL